MIFSVQIDTDKWKQFTAILLNFFEFPVSAKWHIPEASLEQESGDLDCRTGLLWFM